MTRLLSFFRNRYNGLFKLFIFLAAIALLVFIFPKEAKFKYEFQKGKPWSHKDLIAPFDFPIYKAEEQIKEEKAALAENKKLFFRVDTAVKNLVEKKILDDFERIYGEESAKELPNDEYLKINQLIKQLIEKVYQKGIIASTTQIENKESDYSIELINGKEFETKEIGQFLSIRQAYAYVIDGLNVLDDEIKNTLTDFFEKEISHNVFFDETITNQVYEENLNELSLTEGLILKNESVISKGELVDGKKLLMVQSLKKEFENKIGGGNQFYSILFGQILLVSLVMIALGLYLFLFRKSIIASDLKLTFLLLLIVLFVFAAKTALSIEIFSIYLVPFCMLPIVVRTFFDARTALFSHLVLILIVGFIAPNAYEFILIEMLTGIITIFGVLSLKNRGQLFISAAIIFSVYCACYFGISLIQEGNIQNINYSAFSWFFGSAMLTLFAYPLIYMFEKIFGFVSEVTLLEIADTNNKLLRKLNMKAPGTFQHSLQVANLAEEAIQALGGNALLVRVGALYHDIGKMKAPLYFIENQTSNINPHDELSAEESAQIIIKHVKEGIEIAKKNNIPDIIIDFIRTHHGTSHVRYFLAKHKELNPDIEIDESKFTYPGPIPFCKETSVLMMADSVEAASRSLQHYDSESIDKLVEGIIQNQIDEGQYANADITFKDITTIKRMFKKKLKNIYHVRISYPDHD